MTVTGIVPHLGTEDLMSQDAFYVEVLGLRPVHEEPDRIVVYATPDDRHQLTVLTRDIVDASLRPGLLVKVDEIEPVYEAARAAGRPIPYELRDEPWGVRRFFVVDPNGVLVNVVEGLR